MNNIKKYIKGILFVDRVVMGGWRWVALYYMVMVIGVVCIAWGGTKAAPPTNYAWIILGLYLLFMMTVYIWASRATEYIRKAEKEKDKYRKEV